MRILTANDVRAALTMTDAIAAVRAGFIALSAGKAIVPIRNALPTDHGVNLYMPAYVEGSPVTVVKVVAVHAENITRKLPVVLASVIVSDAETGQPLALLDGTTLTAIRTGAGSGVATDLLAVPDASRLAVIGAGAQARTQIEAVCAVRPIQQIRVYSPNSAPSFVAEIADLYDAEVTAADSASAALHDAQVIVAATNSETPVIHLRDVARGAHINGVGSFTPEMQEIAVDVIQQAKVVVDHRDSIWEEAGDLIIPVKRGAFSEDIIYAEIGEIAAGIKPGRESADEITFFKSVGNAVQDAVTAARVLAVAREHGLGTEIAL